METRRIVGFIALGVLVAATTACPAEEEPIEEEVEMAPEAARPDTTAEAVMGYLRQVDYRQNWPMWPGKTALYPGTEPHGALLTTYVNPVTLDAITNRAGRMPDGAMIVKENYAPDSTLAAVTSMYKVRGYNPQHDDWYWIKYLPDGSVEASGRVDPCQQCHGQRAGNDYIFTGSIR